MRHNQSDDRSREVVCALPAEYHRVLVDATPTGDADPEFLIEVQYSFMTVPTAAIGSVRLPLT
jgi:hypothetical protein